MFFPHSVTEDNNRGTAHEVDGGASGNLDSDLDDPDDDVAAEEAIDSVASTFSGENQVSQR